MSQESASAGSAHRWLITRASLASVVFILVMGALLTVAPSAFADGKSYQFSGSGQRAVGPFRLDSGLSVFEISTGYTSGYFGATLYSSQGEYIDLLANTVGTFGGSKATSIDRAGDYYIQVDSECTWTIKVTQPRPTSAPSTREFKGNTQVATPIFYISSGLKQVHWTHAGTGYFGVTLLDRNGEWVELVANTVGSGSGSQLVQFPESGVFLFDVDAESPWTISIEEKPSIFFSDSPRMTTYTHTLGKTHSVWGYIKPKHSTGSTQIKVYAYRYEKKADGTYGYVYKKSYPTTISNPSGSAYSKYKGSVKLPSKGKWRLRAFHAEDSKNARSFSSYRYVTVGETTLSASAPTTVSHAGTAKINGTLKDVNGRVISGRTVKLQRSYDKSKWTDVTKTTTSATGTYSLSHKPKRNTHYRVRFSGDSSYMSKNSSTRLVKVKLLFSDSPRMTTYTHTLGKTHSVWGFIKPKHSTGSTQIKVYAYRYEKKADGTYGYVYKKSYPTTISNPSGSAYSKYKGSVKLPSKGKWRLRAYHAEDSKNAKSYSPYRYVTVK